MSLDAFFNKFGGYTEPYFFYDNTIELRYDPKAHIYYRIENGEFVPQKGVTTVCHIVDKSDALIPWGCKMMAQKLLRTAPYALLPTGDKVLPQQTYLDFEALVMSAKNAHKEKLDEAATVGSAAHNWIEQYIKSVLATDEGRKCYLLANLPEDERARNCCTAALDWMRAHNVRWVCTERKVYSRKYRYAGTMDGLAIVDSCSNPMCCAEPFTDRVSVIDWKSSNYLYLEYLYQTAAYQYAYWEEHGTPITDRWIIRLGKDDGEFDPWHLTEPDFTLDFDAFIACLALMRLVEQAKERQQERANKMKMEQKLLAKQLKEDALKLKCKGADKYKGVREPKCNGGNPCKACLDKYADVQAQKDQDAIVGLTGGV